MINRRKLVSIAAMLSFALVFLGYSIFYLSRFNPVAPIEIKLGFSHLVFVEMIVMIFMSFAYFPKLYQHEKIFLTWIFFALTYAILAIAIGAPSHSLVTQAIGFAQAIGLWLLFRNLDLRNKALARISIASLLVCGIAVQSVPKEITIENAELLSYHTTALIIFMSGFIIATQAEFFISFVAIATTVTFLYINGARTEFYLFCAIGSIMLMKRWGWIAIIVGGTLFLISILAVTISASQLLQIEGASRILGLFDLAEDRSYSVRKIILNDAINTILEHPILGDYSSYEQGYYSHNALSAWVDFGLVGFSIYFLTILAVALSAYKLFSLNKRENLPVLLLVCAFAFSILLSKAYHHPLIGCVVGIVSASMIRDKRKF